MCRSTRLVHGSEVIGSAAVTCSRRMSLKICVFGSEEMCYVNSGCNFFFFPGQQWCFTSVFAFSCHSVTKVL